MGLGWERVCVCICCAFQERTSDSHLSFPSFSFLQTGMALRAALQCQPPVSSPTIFPPFLETGPC